jgi:hypothetical protein
VVREKQGKVGGGGVGGGWPICQLGYCSHAKMLTSLSSHFYGFFNPTIKHIGINMVLTNFFHKNTTLIG